jgi:hypothetical protein
MLAVAAETIQSEPRLVYQAATGDSNPNDMRRIVGMLGLHKRKHFDEKETGFRIVNEIAARMEARAVTPERFQATSAPRFNRAAKEVSSMLDRVRPSWGGGRFTQVVDSVKKVAERVEEVTRETKEAVRVVPPLYGRERLHLRADNVRSLFARISTMNATCCRGIQSDSIGTTTG